MHLNYPVLSAIAVACAAVTAAPVLAQSQAATIHTYAINAGPLASALNDFAIAAGVNLSTDPAQTRGLQSHGLRGPYSVPQGFALLLAGSGLEALQLPNGAYVLRQATAPQASGEKIMAPVLVSASMERDPVSEHSNSYAARAVTVGKGVQTLREIAQSVSVITRQKMDDQNLNTIDAVLANTTGITMYDSPMGGRYVYSRGFMVDTYQFDGVNRAMYYPQANSFTSNTAILDRVEVVRGATGLLQGTGAPGAAVNMVRKRPLAEKQLLLSASAGRWKDMRGEIDVTGPLNESGSIRGRAVAAHEQRDYFYDVADSRTDVLYGVLEFDLAPGSKLTTGASHEKLQSTPFFSGLPLYSDGSDPHLPRSTFIGANWNRWNSRQTAVFAEFEHRFDADWSLKATANYTHERHDVKYMFNLGAINPVTLAGMMRYDGVFDYGTTNKGIDISLDGKFNALGRRHGFSAGVNTNRMESDSDFSLAMLKQGINPWQPDHGVAEPSDAWLREHSYRGAPSLTSMRQTGAYGVARFSVSDSLTVVAGARVTNYQSSSIYRDTGAPYSDPYRENGVVTPYGGLIYALDRQWSAYASVSDIFQPQSLRDAAGALIDPLKGRNLETGIKGELFDGKVNASLALFRIEQSNRAELDMVNVCSSGSECYISTGKVRSEGIDAEISGEVARGWQLFAGYTLNNFKYLDQTSNAGVQFASTFSPRNMLRAWSDYRLPGALQAWSVGGGVNFQTESSRVTQAITVAQKSYALWTARAAYQIDRNWTASVNVTNLFDKRYYQTVGAPSWGNFYGEPRKASLTLRARF
ncbi:MULTISPECIES: TonB-dependent receptor [unclassified Janthinobacterium]|uniref:TonB-dependent siderophore receptor n=1 Tax=unclassified Janthinobacterium TaxID=2610881 RepID=UPI00160C146A|nr:MULTISPECIES: TonB-dependent receptor [unclassified Janthinobacterium]MBB5609839.1 outer membrane receptor for ferric coprogen and ferric-rhodotorulic acid [Janthinobacterium sp. S3T4]MBB5615105.1 outer membrane receptor for ferric coprogen and ferric-rhodotorulic acid [Janthinobacterium sp. S3M3]